MDAWAVCPSIRLHEKVDFNVDWRPPMLEGLSLDLSVSHSGPIVATRDNLVSIPERTLVDVGARYAFKLGDTPRRSASPPAICLMPTVSICKVQVPMT
ncbi:MAG: hypothetical protein HC938_13255 [Nitrospira sp.]|nr:hypothetical protein [Nitrospira sp.]